MTKPFALLAALSTVMICANPLSESAMAQARLQGVNPNIEWIWMKATQSGGDASCPVGHLVGARSYSPAHCEVSINECQSIHGTLSQTPKGDWNCRTSNL